MLDRNVLHGSLCFQHRLIPHSISRNVFKKYNFLNQFRRITELGSFAPIAEFFVNFLLEMVCLPNRNVFSE